MKEHKLEEMMEVDPKLVILIISNQINGQELFRVHVHESSIRFDDKFQKGIEGNLALNDEIGVLNDMWRNHKIDQEQIFPIMLDIMTRHVNYMKQFFFDRSELDAKGQYIEGKPLEPKEFFEDLKGRKLLKRIRKSLFQSNIRSLQLGHDYVERYAPKSKYYHYTMHQPDQTREDWFFMETDGIMTFCFTNK